MADELTTIGKPIGTTIFGGLMLAYTEKGVFWWDEPHWRRIERPVTPANEAASPRSFTAVDPDEPMRQGRG